MPASGNRQLLHTYAIQASQHLLGFSVCRFAGIEKYHVRITLDDLKAMTGEKSLSKFNSDFREYLEIKMYSLDKGYAYKPKGTSIMFPQWKRSASQYPKTFSCMNWIRQSKAFHSVNAIIPIQWNSFKQAEYHSSSEYE